MGKGEKLRISLGLGVRLEGVIADTRIQLC